MVSLFHMDNGLVQRTRHLAPSLFFFGSLGYLAERGNCPLFLTIPPIHHLQHAFATHNHASSAHCDRIASCCSPVWSILPPLVSCVDTNTDPRQFDLAVSPRGKLPKLFNEGDIDIYTDVVCNYVPIGYVFLLTCVWPMLMLMR